jgi:hypothetical protein
VNRLRAGILADFFGRAWMLLAIAGLFIFPFDLHADAGTPLILAGMAHLLIGNCLIGMLDDSAHQPKKR